LKTHCPKLHLFHSSNFVTHSCFDLSGLCGKLEEGNGALCLTVAGIWVSKPVACMPVVLENEGKDECLFPDKQSNNIV
jgi:hypothetical protein